MQEVLFISNTNIGFQFEEFSHLLGSNFGNHPRMTARLHHNRSFHRIDGAGRDSLSLLPLCMLDALRLRLEGLVWFT